MDESNLEPHQEQTDGKKSKKSGIAANPTAEKLLVQLRKALNSDGSIPANAHAVTKFRALASNPNTTSSQIAEIILKEPTLATKLLHIVNSAFYQRARPIMTVTQAVIQIGMEPLAEIFSGIAILKVFANGTKDAQFNKCISKTICTSLLTSSIVPILNPNEDKENELGYLLGMFSELGILSLAHYFPRIYDTAVKRAELRSMKLDSCLREITGLDCSGLALEVIKSLDIPPIYKSVIYACANPELAQKSTESIKRIVNSINVAQNISSAILLQGSTTALDTALEEAQALGIDSQKLRKTLGDLKEQFITYCEALNLDVPPLPEFIDNYAIGALAKSQKIEAGPEDKLSSFIEEVRTSVLEKTPSAEVITTVMETLAWGLKFDRVLLLLLNKQTKKLLGRTIIGQSQLDPKTINRDVDEGSDRFAPDAKAVRESRPVFQGDSILSNGWPIVAIPVGLAENCIGVIYADKICVDLNDTELSDRQKAAITLLTELIDTSLQSKSKK
ncbi:MAG: HDOD domain-containing protein [bacterium]|nr:HDOD domain-containing protein [bacterium]